MGEIAKANDAPFVDLFSISQKLYANAKKEALTINSFYLTEAGDKLIAPEIFRALFDETPSSKNLAKLRAVPVWNFRKREKIPRRFQTSK
jgi:hypothetical protein